MRDASTNRSMWKHILRRVCVENSIFLPSDILNNMPLLELEHTATGPSRFISQVRNPSPGGMIKAYSKHHLSTSLHVLDNPHNDDEDISHIYLIPGGRFLISHHVRQLRMWDIGPPGTNWGLTPFLSPLAILNRYCKNAYVAHSTRDGEGLIILASTSDPWDIMDTCVNSQLEMVLLEASGLMTNFSSERELSIFEIYPAASSPSFREIASHFARVERGKYEQYCLTVDKLVLLFNAEILVWDFIADTKATWALPVAPGKFKHVSTYYASTLSWLTGHS